MYIPSNCADCKIKSNAAAYLSSSELESLKDNCIIASFKKGDSVIKEGIFSSNIIYLKSGLVKLHMKGAKFEQIIKIIKAPSYIGIPTTLNEKFNHYSLTSITDSSVCVVNIETFKSFIQNNGNFAYEVVLELCKNELEIFHKCLDQSQKNLYGRLSDILLFFSEQIFNSDEFDMPLSRTELGSYINVKRESISRVFSDLVNDKIIYASGKKIKILDKEKLKEVGIEE